MSNVLAVIVPIVLTVIVAINVQIAKLVIHNAIQIINNLFVDINVTFKANN